MSSSRALCCFPSVKKQNINSIFFRSMYNNRIIRFEFCDIQNNQGLDKGYQPKAEVDNLDSVFWISQKPHPIFFFIT